MDLEHVVPRRERLDWDAVFVRAAARLESVEPAGESEIGFGAAKGFVPRRRAELDDWATVIADDLRRHLPTRTFMGRPDLASAARSDDSAAAAAVPVVDLAQRLGFEVRYARQLADGRLPSADGGVILVKTGAAPTRARFTIAHELAHVWIGRNRDEIDPWLTAVGHRGTESLCDEVAARLLLPSEVMDWLPRHADLRAATSLSALTSVSLPTIIARACAARGWRAVLMSWGRRDDSWTCSRHSGRPWSVSNWRLSARTSFAGATTTRWRGFIVLDGDRRLVVRMQVGARTSRRATALVLEVLPSEAGRPFIE